MDNEQESNEQMSQDEQRRLIEQSLVVTRDKETGEVSVSLSEYLGLTEQLQMLKVAVAKMELIIHDYQSAMIRRQQEEEKKSKHGPAILTPNMR